MEARSGLAKRAPDVWDSAAFSSIFLDTKESTRQIPFEIEIDF